MLVDIGGGGRSVNGQMLDQLAEWNVDSNLNNEGMHTRCNDTVCNMTTSVVIGNGKHFGYGICSGDMLWSYIHMHIGAISGKMWINGEQYCTSHPVIGTDPSNPSGNEQGFLVGLTLCVDYRLEGKKVRLNKGDVVTVEALYDVDPSSKSYLPIPAGKHGGAMGLFFSVMDCDDGTWGEVFVRRNDTCVPVPGSKAHRVGTVYADRATCEAQGPELELPQIAPTPESQLQPASPEKTHKWTWVDLVWRDCGKPSKWVNFTEVTPDSMRIGGTKTIKASGDLSHDIDGATFQVLMTSGGFGLTLMDFSGDACGKKVGKWTLFDQIHLTWKPLTCPMRAGDRFTVEAALFLDYVIPVSIAHTTTTVLGHSTDGDEIFCFELVTQAPPSDMVV